MVREGLKNIFYLRVEHLTSLQPVFDCLRFLFAKGKQWVYRGVVEIGVRFQEMSVTGSKACKADHIRTIANRLAIFGPGKFAIHLRSVFCG